MLDLSKLEKVRRAGHGHTARCPACAESGNDTTGEHLKIAGDGRFCCVVNPGKAGAWHRKRIFQLAGILEKREPRKAVWRMKR